MQRLLSECSRLTKLTLLDPFVGHSKTKEKIGLKQINVRVSRSVTQQFKNILRYHARLCRWDTERGHSTSGCSFAAMDVQIAETWAQSEKEPLKHLLLVLVSLHTDLKGFFTYTLSRRSSLSETLSTSGSYSGPRFWLTVTILAQGRQMRGNTWSIHVLLRFEILQQTSIWYEVVV